jgi:glycolate oxidase FAD binding subunit
MNRLLTPSSEAELVEAVRSTPHVLAVGAGTKPRLSATDDAVAGISMRKLTGITEYVPDEYTFSALAGTPLHELAEALAAKGQYLPFDPPLAAAGATLGGTVAAGLSGPGRLRYGGLRDFILGARFIDGAGRSLRVGGKVVKNAAGFDLPKFFVGSLGRFGVLTELTFKVFPRPASSLTLRLPVPDPTAAVALFAALGRGRWEANAVDLPPEGDAVYVRLAGPEGTLPHLAHDLLGRWPGAALTPEAADSFWDGLLNLRWSEAKDSWHKLALVPGDVAALCAGVGSLGGRVHISSAGNLAFVALPPGTDASRLGRPALTLRGPGPLWTLPPPEPAITRAVKAALDPDGRFPALARQAAHDQT